MHANQATVIIAFASTSDNSRVTVVPTAATTGSKLTIVGVFGGVLSTVILGVEIFVF